VETGAGRRFGGGMERIGSTARILSSQQSQGAVQVPTVDYFETEDKEFVGVKVRMDPKR
jgi:hypothetical protein